jgi:hypothetical protein
MSCGYWVSLDPNRLSSKLLLMNVVRTTQNISFSSRKKRENISFSSSRAANEWALDTNSPKQPTESPFENTQRNGWSVSGSHLTRAEATTSQAPLSFSIATQAAPLRRSEHGGQNGAPACRVLLGRPPRPASTLTTEGVS